MSALDGDSLSFRPIVINVRATETAAQVGREISPRRWAAVNSDTRCLAVEVVVSSELPLRQAAGLGRRADVVHGFTTRVGENGVRLDLGLAATDHLWSTVARHLGVDGAETARLRQVHGADVFEVQQGGVAGDGDALWTTTPGLVLAVRTADCVPVLLAAGEPCVAVGAAHAGWRGLAAGVLPALVGALRGRVGEVSLHAAIGPAICGRCYEVGPEVVAGISAQGVPESVFVRTITNAPRPFVDVRAAAVFQLQQLGVVTVECATDCTAEDPLLWSHRRDGASRGSLAGVIAFRHTR